MPKDKERSINPAQQQRKLEKAKALKKGRAELQTRRNEKLARRNPERMQREIDDLKALEAKGDLKSREKTILEELEKDLRAVRKARDALGEKATQYGNRQPPRREGGDNSTVLGKRRHDGERRPFPAQTPVIRFRYRRLYEANTNARGHTTSRTARAQTVLQASRPEPTGQATTAAANCRGQSHLLSRPTSARLEARKQSRSLYQMWSGGNNKRLEAR